MERWRKFVKEEFVNPNSGDPETGTLTAVEKWTKAMTKSPRMKSSHSHSPGGQHAYSQRELQKLHPEILRAAITIIDPTGISSWPDLPPAYREYKEEKNAANLFFLILAAISIIPVVGGLGKAAKAEKLRSDRQHNSDHRILQLVARCRAHQ